MSRQGKRERAHGVTHRSIVGRKRMIHSKQVHSFAQLDCGHTVPAPKDIQCTVSAMGDMDFGGVLYEVIEAELTARPLETCCPVCDRRERE